jgi:predicted ATPase
MTNNLKHCSDNKQNGKERQRIPFTLFYKHLETARMDKEQQQQHTARKLHHDRKRNICIGDILNFKTKRAGLIDEESSLEAGPRTLPEVDDDDYDDDDDDDDDDKLSPFRQLVSSTSMSSSFDSSSGSSSFSSSAHKFASSTRTSSKLSGRKVQILVPQTSGLLGITEYRQTLTADFQVKLRRLEQERLYGRQEQVQLLQNILNDEIRRSAQGRPALIQISGISGVGKTALARCLQRPVERECGIYAVGKYDFQHHGGAHTGITQACQVIGKALLQKQMSSLERDQFRATLGRSIKVLSTIVPQIYDLVGAQNKDDHNDDDSLASPDASYQSLSIGGRGMTGGSVSHFAEANRNQSFSFAVGKFLKMVSAMTPLVVVLDDMQWADKESFRLLDVITNDLQTQNLLVVLCYRSDEVDSSRYLSNWLQDVENDDNRKERRANIALSNLDVTAVNDLLADMLTSDIEETSALANIVHKKTLGNPFFVQQFILFLQERNILDFNVASSKWTWDIEDVQGETSATDNVVDQLKNKMKKLPAIHLEILPIAACLGTSFSEPLIVTAAGSLSSKVSTNNDIPNILKMLVDAGFLEKQNDDLFRWTHDKIREAALELSSSGDVAQLQRRVGEVLLDKLSLEDRAKYIFLITGLLNRGVENSKTNMALARLNLDAGRASAVGASFEEASKYLHVGIQCLPKDHWSQEYELSLEMFSLAAEAAYRTGQFEQVDKYCNIVLSSAKSLEDEFRANLVSISAVGSRNNAQRAMEMTIKVLSEYGIRFPKRFRMLSLIKEVIKLKMKQRKLAPEDIASLPSVTSSREIHVMWLLQHLSLYTFLAESILLPFPTLKMFECTVKYGVSELTPVVLSTIAVLSCVKFKVRPVLFCGNF